MRRFKDDPDAMQKALSKAVDRVNAELSVVEKVRRFILADEPFTVENEQLTPSMKIRRHVIGKAYDERLGALYARKFSGACRARKGRKRMQARASRC